jgi:hypothetical protein
MFCFASIVFSSANSSWRGLTSLRWNWLAHSVPE